MQQSEFEQPGKRDAWCVPAVIGDIEYRIIQILLTNSGNPLSRYLNVILILLDTNPITMQAFRNGSSCSGAKKGIEDDIARIG